MGATSEDRMTAPADKLVGCRVVAWLPELAIRRMALRRAALRLAPLDAVALQA